MRYFTRKDTLFIRGSFTAASTGVGGGIREVSTLLNCSVDKGFNDPDPEAFLRGIISASGYTEDFFGMLTAVWMSDLVILQYDFITVFVTAGVTNPDPNEDPCGPHTINIIIVSREPLFESALLETIITATEAKADALRAAGHDFSGTTTDAVIVAFEKTEEAAIHRYAGSCTEYGRRVYEAVRMGVSESLKRHEGIVSRKHPSFFIFSRYDGKHWYEWIKEKCPYYPCHFKGQSCDFCYCPFYPCEDTELGDWVESSHGGKVWGCSRCRLVHIPQVAGYLKENPEASLEELKSLVKKSEYKSSG